MQIVFYSPKVVVYMVWEAIGMSVFQTFRRLRMAIQEHCSVIHVLEEPLRDD